MKRKISEYFKRRKYIFLIAFTILCAGMVTGVFSALNTEIKPEAVLNQLPKRDIIISSFVENVKFLGWIALWGVNLLGFPVIAYLLFRKGASISAAICALTMYDNSQGIILTLSAVPYLVCTIFSVMLLSQGGMRCSFCLFKSVLAGRQGKRLSENIAIMMAEFVPSAALVFFGGICETILKVNIV